MDGDDIAPVEDHKEKEKANLFIPLLILVGIILIGLFTWYLFAAKTDTQQTTIQQTETQQDKEELGDTIYLTLAPEGDFIFSDVYSFDVNSVQLKKVTSDDFFSMTSHISPTGDEMVYTSADRYNATREEYEKFSEKFPEIFSLYSYEETLDEYLRYAGVLQLYQRNLATGETAKITDSSDRLLKRTPKWSPDGNKIAFAARDHYLEPLGDPNTWNVYVTDLNGNEELVTTGLYPHWTDENHMMVLRSDGIYLVDTDLKDYWRILTPASGIDISQFFQFDVSPNHELLALTDPRTKELLLFKITKWDPFTKELITSISSNTSMYWPMFSPGSNYVAVLSLEDSLTDEQKIQLIIYDVHTSAAVATHDLSSFNSDFMFIDDWR